MIWNYHRCIATLSDRLGLQQGLPANRKLSLPAFPFTIFPAPWREYGGYWRRFASSSLWCLPTVSCLFRWESFCFMISVLTTVSSSYVLQMYLLYQQHHHSARTSAPGRWQCAKASALCQARGSSRSTFFARTRPPRIARQLIFLQPVQPRLLPGVQPAHLQGRRGKGRRGHVLPARQPQGSDHSVVLFAWHGLSVGMDSGTEADEAVGNGQDK